MMKTAAMWCPARGSGGAVVVLAAVGGRCWASRARVTSKLNRPRPARPTAYIGPCGAHQATSDDGDAASAVSRPPTAQPYMPTGTVLGRSSRALLRKVWPRVPGGAQQGQEVPVHPEPAGDFPGGNQEYGEQEYQRI